MAGTNIGDDVVYLWHDSYYEYVSDYPECDPNAVKYVRADREDKMSALVQKSMASSQPSPTNNELNKLRLEAFKTNNTTEYFEALNLAFQRGDLIAYDLVETTNI